MFRSKAKVLHKLQVSCLDMTVHATMHNENLNAWYDIIIIHTL